MVCPPPTKRDTDMLFYNAILPRHQVRSLKVGGGALGLVYEELCSWVLILCMEGRARAPLDSGLITFLKDWRWLP